VALDLDREMWVKVNALEYVTKGVLSIKCKNDKGGQ